MIKFKDRLYEAMSMRGMKQIELSEKTGIGKSSISQWLSGRNEPNKTNIGKLSKALNVSPEWMMGYEDAEMERKTEEEHQKDSYDIDQDMSDMMIGKIVSLWNALTFEQRVEVYSLVRRKELDYEATKQNRDNL